MANTQSEAILAVQGTPAKVADRHTVGSHTVTTSGSVAVVFTTAADTCQLFRIPSRANLLSLQMIFDDLATTSITLDIGFYEAGSGLAVGAAVNIDALVTDLDVSAAIAQAEYRYEVLDHNTTGQEVWEIAGESAAPEFEEMDVVITVAASSLPLTGDVSWIAVYTN